MFRKLVSFCTVKDPLLVPVPTWLVLAVSSYLGYSKLLVRQIGFRGCKDVRRL
jgi:hypothetical protein